MELIAQSVSSISPVPHKHTNVQEQRQRRYRDVLLGNLIGNWKYNIWKIWCLFAKPAKQFSQDRTYMVLTDQFKTAAQRGAMSGNSNVFIMFIMFPTDDCFSQNISKRRPFEEFLCGSHRRAWPSQGQGCGHQHSTSTAFKVKIEKDLTACIQVFKSSTQFFVRWPAVQLRSFLPRRHGPINKWQIKTEGRRRACQR